METEMTTATIAFLIPHDEVELSRLAVELAHKLVDDTSLTDQGRIRALDEICATLRHRWALEGKSWADAMVDSQAFRTVANRTILELEVQRRRKQK
jgi:hypothetical protein